MSNQPINNITFKAGELKAENPVNASDVSNKAYTDQVSPYGEITVFDPSIGYKKGMLVTENLTTSGYSIVAVARVDIDAGNPPSGEFDLPVQERKWLIYTPSVANLQDSVTSFPAVANRIYGTKLINGKYRYADLTAQEALKNLNLIAESHLLAFYQNNEINASGELSQLANSYKGYIYRVNIAGTLSGKALAVGDMLICHTTFTGNPSNLNNFDHYASIKS